MKAPLENLLIFIHPYVFFSVLKIIWVFKYISYVGTPHSFDFPAGNKAESMQFACVIKTWDPT